MEWKFLLNYPNNRIHLKRISQSYLTSEYNKVKLKKLLIIILALLLCLTEIKKKPSEISKLRTNSSNLFIYILISISSNHFLTMLEKCVKTVLQIIIPKLFLCKLKEKAINSYRRTYFDSVTIFNDFIFQTYFSLKVSFNIYVSENTNLFYTGEYSF